MKKYVILDGYKCTSVGMGDDVEFYKSIGMTLEDVELGYDGTYYLVGHAPVKPAPTYDEVKEARAEYRRSHIDDKTLERNRKTANGTWTEQDEAEYLELDREVTAWIEENLPYPIGGD